MTPTISIRIVKIRLYARQEPAHRSGPIPSKGGLVYKASAALFAASDKLRH